MSEERHQGPRRVPRRERDGECHGPYSLWSSKDFQFTEGKNPGSWIMSTLLTKRGKGSIRKPKEIRENENQGFLLVRDRIGFTTVSPTHRRVLCYTRVHSKSCRSPPLETTIQRRIVPPSAKKSVFRRKTMNRGVLHKGSVSSKIPKLGSTEKTDSEVPEGRRIQSRPSHKIYNRP